MTLKQLHSRCKTTAGRLIARRFDEVCTWYGAHVRGTSAADLLPRDTVELFDLLAPYLEEAIENNEELYAKYKEEVPMPKLEPEVKRKAAWNPMDEHAEAMQIWLKETQ